jgi:hypothetical protein
MRRTALGWIVVCLLTVAGLLHVWFPSEIMLRDGCLRCALVLGLVWLALPQLLELPRWAVATTLTSALLVLWRPKLLLFALPVLLAMWFLRPRVRRL